MNVKKEEISDSISVPLSVVVATICDSINVERCLNAISCQVGIPHFETVVAHDNRIDNVKELKEKFPSVKFVYSQGKLSFEKLRALGVHNTRGKLIAITADFCIPDNQWCAKIIDAHTNSYAAVGGIVEKGNIPDNLFNWAFHFCNFHQFLRPATSGYRHKLIDCNLSYKRIYLNKTINLWEHEFFVDFVNSALLENKQALWLSNNIIVTECLSIGFTTAMHEQLVKGKRFACKRVVNLSAIRKMACLIFSPMLPILLLLRISINVLLKKRYFSKYVCTLPYITLFTLFWSIGESIGYFSSVLFILQSKKS